MTNPDMLKTIEPKTDQANFDDFLSGSTKTIKVTKVSAGDGEQPVIINFEGDNGKPYKPGKSMRRVLVHVWGKDAANYVGRSMTLYGDPKVKFGGLEVGGIRISHMSHITEPMTMALTAARALKKPFTVKPLIVAEIPSADDYISDIESAPTLEGLQHKFAEAYKAYKSDPRIVAAKDKRKAELTPAVTTEEPPAEEAPSNKLFKRKES